MSEISYTACVMGPEFQVHDNITEGTWFDDDLVEVDIRDLTDAHLEGLRVEAFAAGDHELVEAINSLGRV